MWKTPDRFWAEIGPYDHILALKKGQIHCAAVDLALFRKPDVSTIVLNRRRENNESSLFILNPFVSKVELSSIFGIPNGIKESKDCPITFVA
jgi:hypothetical protein